MLMSDLKHNFVRTYSTALHQMDLEKFQSIFAEMEREATALLLSEHIPEGSIKHVYSLELRYVKQYHEVNVEVTKKEITKGDISAMIDRFHPEHNRLFGYSLEEQATPVELINLRLLSVGQTVKPQFKREEYDQEDPSKALKKRRKVYLPGEERFEDVPVYDGHKLCFGNKIEGPALIEQVNTTTFVTPDYSVLCDQYGSYTMYLKTKEAEIEQKLGLK
jgi:N-methylhydantoinase A